MTEHDQVADLCAAVRTSPNKHANARNKVLAYKVALAPDTHTHTNTHASTHTPTHKPTPNPHPHPPSPTHTDKRS